MIDEMLAEAKHEECVRAIRFLGMIEMDLPKPEVQDVVVHYEDQVTRMTTRFQWASEAGGFFLDVPHGEKWARVSHWPAEGGSEVYVKKGRVAAVRDAFLYYIMPKLDDVWGGEL